MVSNETRLTRTFIYVVDTSSDMMNGEIDTVNSAINDVIKELGLISVQHCNVPFEIAVLTFSGEGATWQTLDAADYTCNINTKGGEGKISAAFKELYEKLSNNDFMDNTEENCPLAILLLACHELDDDYEKTLNILKTNKRFKNALKYAVAIGRDIDIAALEKFTGSKGTVPGPVVVFDHLKREVCDKSIEAAQLLAKMLV